MEKDARRFLRNLRAGMRAALGLPPLRAKAPATAPAAGAAEEAAKGEWMDEEDDEEDE